MQTISTMTGTPRSLGLALAVGKAEGREAGRDNGVPKRWSPPATIGSAEGDVSGRVDDVDADADLSDAAAVSPFGGGLEEVTSAEELHDPTRPGSVVHTAHESK